MNNKQHPNWQPISMLPMIVYLIDNQFKDVKEEYNRLLKVRSKPHVLDDETIQRNIKAYKEQLDFFSVYEKQIEKWQEESSLTGIQRNEFDRLQGNLKKFRKMLIDLLDLVDELKKRTIEKVMEKSDIELVGKFLSK